MLCGGVGGNIIMFQIRFQCYNFIFWISLQFLNEFNKIFHVKGLNQLTIGKRPKKKNIESLDLT